MIKKRALCPEIPTKPMKLSHNYIGKSMNCKSRYNILNDDRDTVHHVTCIDSVNNGFSHALSSDQKSKILVISRAIITIYTKSLRHHF